MKSLALALPFVTAGLLLAQTPAPTTPPGPAPSATPSPTPEAPVAGAVPPKPREIIDVLSDAQLDQAITSLRNAFLDPARTTDRDLKRATLEGLVQRLSPGVVITTDVAVRNPGPSPAFLAEILDARIGYLRLGAISREALMQMDAALANFREKNLKAVILDLRGERPSSDYDLAASMAKRFCPRGKLLFSIEKPSAKQERILTSDEDPHFSGIVVVVTDAENSGAAEALAATLRANANALVIGATTRGEAVEYADVTLGDGKILRVAVAQVTIPGVGPIFPHGVKPDIAAALTPEAQATIFVQAKEKGVSQFVFEVERPHLNEAALVANTNPEMDPDFARDAGRKLLWDTVLQRAVDLVTAISFYNDQPAPAR